MCQQVVVVYNRFLILELGLTFKSSAYVSNVKVLSRKFYYSTDIGLACSRSVSNKSFVRGTPIKLYYFTMWGEELSSSEKMKKK